MSENSKESAARKSSASSDEDWEARADQTPEPASHSQMAVEVSKLYVNNQSRTCKQQGRGVFTYGQNALYNDQTIECALYFDEFNQRT